MDLPKMISPAKKTAAIFICLILAGITSADCTNKNMGGPLRENAMAVKSIEDVLKEQSGILMTLPGVVGTALGLCDDQPCIKVYVLEKTPELERKIPAILEGYPVMMEETGPIRALPKGEGEIR